MSSHTKEKLLRNILDPNADIQPGYQAYTCLLDSGEILSGLLAGETSVSLSIKAAGGEVRTITRAEIEKLQNLNISFMPEGLEANITPQDMSDLLQYLLSPSSPASKTKRWCEENLSVIQFFCQILADKKLS